MSTAYYIALENEEVEFDTFVNGKAIAHASEELYELCESNSIKPLDEFLSQDVSEFIDDFEMPDGMEITWFDAQEGIDCVLSLVKLIQSKDCTFEKGPVIEDLNEYLEVLNKVKQANLKWHLELDI